VSTLDAVLVLDDAVCPSKAISEASRVGIYERLRLDALWQVTEYAHRITDAGYEVTWAEDLTPHCIKSYQYLAASALRHGEADLAADYEKTVAGCHKGDFGWHAFIAKRKYFGAYYDDKLPTYLQVWGEDGRVGWGYYPGAFTPSREVPAAPVPWPSFPGLAG
jgi:hypothetical protein